MGDGSQQAVAFAVWVKSNLFWVSVVIQSGVFMVAGRFLLPVVSLHLGKVKNVFGRALSFFFVFNLLLILSSIGLMRLIVFVLTAATPWVIVIMTAATFFVLTLLALWQSRDAVKRQVKK